MAATSTPAPAAPATVPALAPAVTLRDATEDDLVAINTIYNYYVHHSKCTYQTEDNTMEERMEWWKQHSKERYPVIVAVRSDDPSVIIGWASLNRHHPRQGYRFSVDTSLYLHHEHVGKGVGSMLLQVLIDRAVANGFHVILANMDSGQTASMKLHGKFGFKEVGRLHQVGKKFDDTWLDTVWMQRILE